ncbi:hypothetical protein FHG66_17350 [Rubellimicrobium rubrum]|uniref:DUF4157 domain-containing protein n=1 Tax=Rubellimicrobium rubrum TaxID=2585369 RepID=A0A5C4MN51_9RHOB|nr:hypothetical protein [Rubellimicrobium rubrum]TNC47231.1 hypothetical protein FHG66_17350 [Rubellimicrobium rubrum]
MRRTLLALLLLTACGRPLTPGEVAFLSGLHGPALDTSRVRLHDAQRLSATRILPTPPRLTCQARLFPPPQGETIRTATGAISLFEDIYVRRDLYRDDMVEGWPEVLPLADAMLLAHEMVHAWQWQNRALTRYHPLKAALEHAGSADPYLFDLDTSTDFLGYGYEQQGSIMEEYVCCRSLAPESDRTERLHTMLSEYFPLRPLDEPMTEWIALPWDGVKVEGICDGAPLPDRGD